MIDRALRASSDEIVEQHGRISSLLSELHATYARGIDWDELARTLDHVLDVVRQHFADEETQMTSAGYPKLVEHQASHATFLRRVQVLRSECNRRETELMSMFIDLLDAWFRNHERTADQHVLSFLERASKD